MAAHRGLLCHPSEDTALFISCVVVVVHAVVAAVVVAVIVM